MADETGLSARRSWIGGIGALLIVGAALVGGITIAGRVAEAQSPEIGLKREPVVGALTPGFTLMNLEGEQVNLDDFRGRPVLINLWATWCGPCRIEMPAIQSRFERYQDDGFAVLAVNFDEHQTEVQAFRDEFVLTFQILLDPGAEVQKLYRNRSYPSSFFIDRAGVIQVQHIGVMTEGQLDENLKKIGLGS
jgi:peroxiredoxin